MSVPEDNQPASTLGRFRRTAALAAIGVFAAVALVAAACGGGDSGSGTKTPSGSPTKAVSKTPSVTRTPAGSLGLKTPIAFSEGDLLSEADLLSRGVGEPGRGPFTGAKLIIPKIEIDAEFSTKLVGGDGQMPNPNGPEDVAWYDFADWPGLGGVPLGGGNVVMAGHVDYINYGPAVFWRLSELVPGDEIEIRLQDGTVAKYRVEFNKSVDPGDADWSGLVQATADESITLITCTGEFEAGHYTNRQIVWGRRIA